MTHKRYESSIDRRGDESALDYWGVTVDSGDTGSAASSTNAIACSTSGSREIWDCQCKAAATHFRLL